jgi:hypothetical protein
MAANGLVVVYVSRIFSSPEKPSPYLHVHLTAVDSNNNNMVWLWPLKNSPPLFPDEPGCFGHKE